MKRRAHRTVLFLGALRQLRVDLDSDNRPLDSERSERDALALPSLVDTLDQLLQGAPAPAARVVVIAESLWTQTLELPEAALAGLDMAAQARLLAFELEPLSGIPAPDAEVAHARVGTNAARVLVWATLVAGSERAALENRLERLGARLEALAHPAGLAPVSAADARVEVWEGATLCCEPGPRARVRVLASRPGQRSWETGVTEWAEPLGARSLALYSWSRESVAPAGVRAEIGWRALGPAGEGWPEWLAAAARELVQPAPLGPRFAPARRRDWAIGPRAVGMLLALAALGFVGWRHHGSEVHAQDLEARAKVSDEMKTSAKDAQTELAALSKQVGELAARARAATARAEAVEGEWRTQAQRIARLVSELALRRPPGITLRAIECDESGAELLQGAGTDPQTVQSFSAQLGPELAKAGWAPQPASTLLKSRRDGLGFCEFTLLVEQPSGLGARGRAPRGESSAPARRKRSD